MLIDPPNPLLHLLKQRRSHLNPMTSLRKTSVANIRNVLAEGRDSLLLQAAVFLRKIPTGLGVARRGFVVVAENVVGK